MSDHNPYEPAVSVSKRDAEAVPSPTLDLDPTTGPEQKQDLPEAPDSGEAVPDGTIKEVLDWVGDSKDRAAQAEKSEKASDEPRQTLLHRLKKVHDA
jgi:hypothetical protein